MTNAYCIESWILYTHWYWPAGPWPTACNPHQCGSVLRHLVWHRPHLGRCMATWRPRQQCRVPTSRSLRAAVRRTVKHSSWQAGDRRSAHFNLARGPAHAAFRQGTHGASRGAEGMRETLVVRYGVWVGWCPGAGGWKHRPRTGLQRARSSHSVSASALRKEHGLGKCTGCRAGCQMWPAWSRPLVSLSMALPLLRRAVATVSITKRRSARRVALVRLVHRSTGLTAKQWVSKRRCVWNRPVYGRVRVRSQTSVNGTEIDATTTPRAPL